MSGIVRAVLDAAERDGARPAIIFGEERVSYSQLCARSAAVAGALRERAAGEETLALLCGNAPEFAYGVLGARWAGKRVALLPTLAPAPMLAMMCAEVGAKVALVSRELAPKAKEAALTAIEIEGAAETGQSGGVAGWPSALHESQVTSHEPRGASDHSAAIILYTSGSTGRPKAVLLSEENVLSNVQGCIEAMKFTRDEVMLAILPLFHSYGLTVTLLLPLTLGARTVIEKFSPRAVLGAIEKHRVTALIAVPSQYRLLAKDPMAVDVGSLRFCIAGAERLPELVGRDFETRFGKAILQGYGCTETSPVIAINPPWANKSESVGPPLPNIRVTIRENWVEVPRGEQGEICVEGPSVMLGYHNQPEATADKMRDGVLRTADRGFLDADGYLHIAGRADDMLKVAGEKIYPAEVEQAIEQIAGVEEAAVIGVPDDVRGVALLAYVQPKAGAVLNEAMLRAGARERLEAIKVPRSFEIVEQLPRTPTGKLDKKNLGESGKGKSEN